MTTRLNLRRIGFAASIYLTLTAVFLCHSILPAESQTSPETPKLLYQDRCSACHNAYDPAAQAFTLTQWRSTVNRMLYKHGASAEISPADTQTILTYLAAFAVPDTDRPQTRGGQGLRRVDNSDVWAVSPTYSRVYVFGADAALAQSMRPVSSGIVWKILTPNASQQLALRAKENAAGPDLVLLPLPKNISGGLRLESVFQRAQPSTVTGKAPVPLSFGLAFGSELAGADQQYDIVRYDSQRGVVDLIATNGKVTKVLFSQTLNTDQAASKSALSLRTLRVDVLGSRVKAWLDYDKVIDAQLGEPPTTPVAGLWTGSRASVHSVAVDCYPA